MKEAIILDELKNMIDSKGTDFESLRNAVETRKLVKELEGIRLSRYLAVLSVIISFSLLFWQGFQSLDAATRELKKDHIDTLNSKIEGKTEEISDLEKTITDLQLKIQNLNKDKEKLGNLSVQIQDSEKEIDRLKKLQAVLNQQNTELSSSYSTATTLEKEREKRQELERSMASLENNLSTIENTLSTVEQKLENANKRLASLSDLSGYEYKDFIDGNIGKTIDLKDYIIKFTNVGDKRDNLDFMIQAPNGSKTTIRNLNTDHWYTFRFDSNLFLVHVINVQRSPKDKSKERGTFRIGVLPIDAFLVN